MSVQIFSSSNPALELAPGAAQELPFQGICIGLVVEWARKVLAGTKMEQSRPRERASRDLARLARSFQVEQLKKQQQAQDLRDAWEGALAAVGLQAIPVVTDAMTGPQLLAHLCQVIPPGALGGVSIASPAQGKTSLAYRSVALMRQHPEVEPGPLLFFDPAFGLYQADNPEDFAATTDYLKVYSAPAWAYAITPGRSVAR